MFKRFLKFLKGDEVDRQDDRFEGSYLDHLLSQIYPVVKKDLEDCPEHDPVLLVVTAVLRETMPNVWASGLPEPLVDSQTPGIGPPPPPANPTAETEAEEVVVDLEVDLEPDVEESEDGDRELAPADPGSQPSKKDTVIPADPSDAPKSSAESEDSTDASPDDSESNDVVETAEFDRVEAESDEDEKPQQDSDEESSEAGDDSNDARGSESTSPSRITEEINIRELESESESEEADTSDDGETKSRKASDTTEDITVEVDREVVEKAQKLPQLKGEDVLRSGRSFLGLLLNNDELPIDLQLTVSEIMLARDLLLGYFVGDDNVDSRAKEVRGLVERKFSDGLFSQAQILLDLFPTDETTRINNDRNLFYEDMILRLGIRRRSALSIDQINRFSTLCESMDDPGIRALFAWLDETCLIKFRLRLRDHDQCERWHKLSDTSSREDARAVFKEQIPPRRWRPVDAYPDLEVAEQVRDHVGLESARHYTISQLKACYFVLRAVGDTGLEGYLDSFFDWTLEHFDLDGTRLMPILYTRSMSDSAPMDAILGDIYETYFAAVIEEKLDTLGDQDVESALSASLDLFSSNDLGEVAPGYYDLGGFVYDRLFEMSYPSPEFASKLHRLT